MGNRNCNVYGGGNVIGDWPQRNVTGMASGSGNCDGDGTGDGTGDVSGASDGL